MAAGKPGGKPVTDRQKEILLEAFAESGNMSYAAREAGLPISTARQVALARHDEFTALRKEKRVDLINAMHIARRTMLEELTDPTRLKNTSTKDLATAFAVITDKIQLLSGGPTHSVTIQRLDPTALTPEEREQARQFRDKMLAARAEQAVEVVDVDGRVIDLARGAQ